MARGILTNWERGVIASKNAKWQYRYRVKVRLKETLKMLPEDIIQILYSKRLAAFNQEHQQQWALVALLINKGLEDLKNRFDVISYDVIESFKEGGQDHFYISGKDQVHITQPVNREFVGVSLSPVISGPADVILDEDVKKKYMRVGEDGLKLWLSLVKVKEHQRRFIRKALKLGYVLPTSKKDAVALSDIKEWIKKHDKKRREKRDNPPRTLQD